MTNMVIALITEPMVEQVTAPPNATSETVCGIQGIDAGVLVVVVQVVVVVVVEAVCVGVVEVVLVEVLVVGLVVWTAVVVVVLNECGSETAGFGLHPNVMVTEK